MQTGRLNLASKLESALPENRLALFKTIALAASEMHAALFVVGGFVRDLLLDRPSLDFDLVVEGDAIALARHLSSQHGGRVTGHTRFGTAKWHLPGANSKESKGIIRVEGLPSVDLVSARTEFYTYPSALPTVERGSIKLDLHRRDFTINTMALRLDGRHYGELHDYWGGLNDLRTGLVRVLHSLSFVDDPTRILRAIRFEQRLGFQVEERTMELMLEARPLIDRLSGDRIRHELNYILESAYTAQIMSRLSSLGMIRSIHPDLGWDDWLHSQFEDLKGIEVDRAWGIAESGKRLERDLGYCLWMIQLEPETTRSVAKRLKLPLKLSQVVRTANQLWLDRQGIKDLPPSGVVQRLEDLPVLACLALYRASSDSMLRSLLFEYYSKWQYIKPTIDGHHLRMLGIPPGPIYRILLQGVRNAWLDGIVKNQEEEKAFLMTLLKSI